MQICVSHGGPNLYRGETEADRVLVATVSGVVDLARTGGRWQEAGRTLVGKHVSALLIVPGHDLVFAGTHGDGLYRSRDNALSWEAVSVAPDARDFYALNAAPLDGRMVLYAGTEPAHLYASADLGWTWSELEGLRNVPSVGDWTFPAQPHLPHVRGVAFDPRSDKVLYAAIEVGGFFKSEDSGRTWHEFRGYYEDVHRIALQPGHPDSIYLATGNGLWHSSDGGEAWAQLTDRDHRVSYPDGLIVHPDKPDTVFISGAISRPRGWRDTHRANARVAKSRDAGKTWSVSDAGFPENMRGNIDALSLALAPAGSTLFAGTTDGTVYSSTDEAETWMLIADAMPPVSIGGHYVTLSDPDVVTAPRR